jgi:hypothetical protein
MELKCRFHSTESAASLLTSTGPREVWQISPEHTASRLLTLVTVLRGLLAYDGTDILYFRLLFTNSVEECEQYASQVIAFYIASLSDAVGPLWQAPSLSSLARYWFHSSCTLVPSIFLQFP